MKNIAQHLNKSQASDKTKRLYSEQVKLLYSNTPGSMIATLVNSSIISFILRNVISHTTLIAWLVCIFLITVIRYWLVYRYKHASCKSLETKPWGTWLIIGIAAIGIVWGAAGIFLFPAKSIAHQVLLTLVLAGMSAGTVATYSVIMRAFLAFSLPSAIPIIVRFLIMGGDVYSATGGMALVFVIIMLITARRVHITIVSSLKLRFENSGLIDSLTAAKEHAENLNDDLKSKITESSQVEHDLKISETRFKDIVLSMSDWVWELDANGTYTYCSEKVQEILGYTTEEITGKTPFDFMPENEAVRINNIFRKVAENKNFIKDLENWSIHKQGHRVCLLTNATPRVDDQGNLAGYRGVDKDITERKQAEEKLKQTTDMLQSIMDSSTEIIIIATDPSGLILSWNEGAGRLLGYETEEVVGKESVRIFHTKEYLESGKMEPGIKKMISTRKPLVADLIYVAKDGNTFPVQQIVTPRFNDDGRFIGMLGMSHDITEQKRAENELQQAKEAAEAINIELENTNRQLEQAIEKANQMAAEAEIANIAKSEFLANMSHEIRTPMNGVIGMTSLLLDTKLSSEQCEYAESVKFSAESLLGLINDILDFSKIEAGKLELEMLNFPIYDVVYGTADMVAHKAHAKGLELITNIDPAIPSYLHGDPSRIRQILLNLAGNAIKFTEQGEIIISAELMQQNEANIEIRFCVKDTGIGIPAERQQAIFKSFSQADGSTTRKYGGTGLGLTISKQLAELMDGKIGVISETGKGSTFWFSVKAQPGSVPEDAQENQEINRADFEKLPVLIIDDNATNRTILKKNVENFGCPAFAVEGGIAGLAELQRASDEKQPYRIVLLDMMMPELDGKQTAQRIKQASFDKPEIIVLISSADDRFKTDELQAYNIIRSLSKPVKSSTLFNTLVELVHGRRNKKLYQQPQKIVTDAVALPVAETHHLRILLAEDNIINQKIAQRMLEKKGYSVDVAANGLEAVEALSRINYALVLMDVQMPELDGLEATKMIREAEGKMQNKTHIPIVALTANAMKGDKELCLNAGMDDYLSKPIDPEALRKMLGKWLVKCAC